MRQAQTHGGFVASSVPSMPGKRVKVVAVTIQMPVQQSGQTDPKQGGVHHGMQQQQQPVSATSQQHPTGTMVAQHHQGAVSLRVFYTTDNFM